MKQIYLINEFYRTESIYGYVLNYGSNVIGSYDNETDAHNAVKELNDKTYKYTKEEKEKDPTKCIEIKHYITTMPINTYKSRFV